MVTDTDAIKAGLGRIKPAFNRRQLLSSGSTLVNLACSGHPSGAFLMGSYNFTVGDSASGKTWLTLQCLAEAAINKRFDNYRFIHDNAENGALMNLAQYFGRSMAERLEPPRLVKGRARHSRTAEDFKDNVDAALEDSRPFIYIIDSFDCLTSQAEEKKDLENRKARTKGAQEKGDYGDGKPKIFSRFMRKLPGRLDDAGSIVIGISQTRDDIGSMFGGKTHSGGHALKFYATLQLWSSIAGRIKKEVKGKKETIGINCRIAVKKNRLTGVERTVTVPIYYSYGMDDIGSCIDFITEKKHWKKAKGTITATELDFEGPREKLIKKIEEDSLQTDLGHVTHRVWLEIEDALRLDRRARYGD